MRKDRIIKGAIKTTIDKVKECDDCRTNTLNNSDVEDLINIIIEHHVHTMRCEMLSGEHRVIIPKIGSFSKTSNKAIFNKIKSETLERNGYSNWSDVPSENRSAIITEINSIAKVKFKSIKTAKRNKAVDKAKQISEIINKKGN